jgi:hypothetical protein
MVILLRVVLFVLVLWGLWKLYIALFPPRRAPQARVQDEWEEVLDAIDELPETTDLNRHAQHRNDPLRTLHPQSDNASEKTGIESVIVHEAEAALTLMKQGGTRERLAAYHEIATYEKLCTIADAHISEATWKRVDDIRRQAWDIIGPPDEA